MYHQADALLALTTEFNPDAYTKTWGTNDFYLKDTDPSYPYPLGQVQPVGSFHHEMMKGDAPPLTPGFVLEAMKHHAVPWWLTTEDLPDPENRVTIHNTTPLWAGHATGHVPLHAYFKKRIPIEGVGHQNGTCRMGTDPATSVLDVNCKAHDLENLYVVDASCFVSAAAVNPSLTIIANAIRVAEHLIAERLS
jgi:choline dehydrogenase-like flavoprotein